MIYTGTCSWTEKSLIQSGEFYPGTVKTSEGRLRYYAGHFDTVEVDSTYYAIPDKRTTYLWADRTPENFIFHIKAYGALTGHGIDPKTLPRDIFDLLPEKDRGERYVYIKEPSILEAISEKFRETLSPLKKTDKLGMLVFQFPPWFQYRTMNLDYIRKSKELMKGLPIAVEFRHGSWLTNSSIGTTLGFLRENQLTYITADEPQYGSLATVPFIPEATTETAYFRFHGRNKENWLKKGIATTLRFAYLYSDDEMKEFNPSIQRIDRKARKTYLMFNNCHGGFAMKNALRMKEMLKTERVRDVPKQ
ncbi:MAG: hypothetical protein A2Y97_09555 [Nitrospirae bacterium RBG_13_39_12]|nr:MAG: hypothetical protein A2Y97_09555 [Nitrospirae bacterium RBG_13_39_12]